MTILTCLVLTFCSVDVLAQLDGCMEAGLAYAAGIHAVDVAEVDVLSAELGLIDDDDF